MPIAGPVVNRFLNGCADELDALDPLAKHGKPGFGFCCVGAGGDLCRQRFNLVSALFLADADP